MDKNFEVRFIKKAEVEFPNGLKMHFVPGDSIRLSEHEAAYLIRKFVCIPGGPQYSPGRAFDQ